MERNRKASRRTLLAALVVAALATGTAWACYCSTGTIIVKKFYDKNANGIHDVGEVRLAGWPMSLGSASLGPLGVLPTDSFGYAQFSNIPIGTDYIVTEATPLGGNWVQSAPVDAQGHPINPQTGIAVQAGKTTQLTFGNYCTKPSGGRTPGYWHNKNGLATLMDGGTLAPEFAILSALNLVGNSGSAFDPTNHPQFATWLLDSNATNMAWKLSTHLAAMRLNVEAGFVDGTRIYAPFGGTINELIAVANASLADSPYTPSGHPDRAEQEVLKNYLDALNNGAGVVNPTPCARVFEY
jgi:hypothetical protein